MTPLKTKIQEEFSSLCSTFQKKPETLTQLQRVYSKSVPAMLERTVIRSTGSRVDLSMNPWSGM
jgi:hypothetical protein